MLRPSLLSICLLAAALSASFAQVTAVPNSMNFQGRLARPDGTPILNGNYTVRIRLYNAATAGNVKFEQTIPAVAVKNSVFAITLSNFPAGTFNGNLFLGIKIGTDAELTPRQPISPVAYAFKAESVRDGAITGASIANGAITANKFANDIFNPLAWLPHGNSGVTNGFLGTTDSNPLELRANNRRAVRYSEASDGVLRSVNILGGSELNTVGAGVIGATIAGGGQNNLQDGTLDAPNQVNANFGAIGGGYGNLVSGDTGTVAGGLGNVVQGVRATVGGGHSNAASAAAATVAGGFLNTASGIESTVAGGILNTASGSIATVAGGKGNKAAGTFSFAAGQRASANHDGTFVWSDGQLADFVSTGVNQFLLHAAGGVGINTNSPNSSLFAVGGGATGARLQIGGAGGDAHHLSSGRDMVFNAVGGLFTFRSLFSLDDLASYTDQFTINSNGSAVLRGALKQNSDARWKKNVATFDNALDVVLNLRGVTYEWKEVDREAGRQIGFIAQEVEKVLPELVGTDAKGYKSVAYANVVPVLVEAVKTLKKENDAKEKRLTEVEAKNAALEARLAAIEQALIEIKTSRK